MGLLTILRVPTPTWRELGQWVMTTVRFFRTCLCVFAVGVFAEIAASAPIVIERDDVSSGERETASAPLALLEPRFATSQSLFATDSNGRYQAQWRPGQLGEAPAGVEYAYAFVQEGRRPDATRALNIVDRRVLFPQAPVQAAIGVIPTAIPILALGLAVFGLLARRRSDEVQAATQD
jgi:hypothetical protein